MLKDRRLPRQGVSQVIRTLEKLTHGLFTGFRQRSPDKIASIERRRRLAASGSVPAHPVGCYAGSLHIDAIANAVLLDPVEQCREAGPRRRPDPQGSRHC